MTTPAKNTSNIGSAILALSGMLSRTYGKKPSGKQVKCQIMLEKLGVLNNVDTRVKTGQALSKDAYREFAKLAKTDDGAKKVLELAKQVLDRNKAIQDWKATHTA